MGGSTKVNLVGEYLPTLAALTIWFGAVAASLVVNLAGGGGQWGVVALGLSVVTIIVGLLLTASGRVYRRKKSSFTRTRVRRQDSSELS